MTDDFKFSDHVLALSLRQALTFISFGLLLSCAGFVAGLSISRLDLPAALLLAFVLGIDRTIPAAIRTNAGVTAFLAMLALLAASVGASSCFLDSSSDGNTYHLVSIIGLRDGWNPIRDSSFIAWANGSGLYPSKALDNLYGGGIWTDHYPKASWILSSLVLMWVPKLEGASWQQLFVAVFAAISLRQGFRWAGLRSGWATILAVGAALSPVMLAQLFTNYVDGLLGSWLLIEAGLLLTAHVSGRMSHALEASMAALVASDLKFTGLVYAILLLACFVIVSRPLRKIVSDIGRHQRLKACVCMAGIVVVCWNPYGTNLVNKGHPFHPLDKIDVMEGQADPEFLRKGRWVKFLGASTGALSPRKEPNSAPFWAERPALWRYLKSISETDPLKQGYGPHFLLILSMALCVGIGIAWQSFRTRKDCPLMDFAQVYLMWLVGCMLLNPEFWWARYLPQLWATPFVMCALAVANRNHASAIVLATPAILSGVIFVLCFILLLDSRIQKQQQANVAWHDKDVLRVVDTAGNSRHLFVAAALAAEHGMRLEMVPALECQVIKLPMIAACAL